MSADPDTAASAQRNPWSSFGWLVWAPWMVFLFFPAQEALAAAAVLARVSGLIGTVVFGLVYTAGFLALFGRDDAASVLRRGVPRPQAALAVLVLLTLVLVPALGLGVLSFAPFLIALGVFALPRPWCWWWAGAVAVTSLLVPWTLDPSPGWYVLSFIVVAVGLGTASGRFLSDSDEAWTSVRDDLTVTTERERVARDVHDVLGHTLTVVSIKAELAERLVEVDPARARAEMVEVQQLTRQALAEVRVTVGGLRAARLEDELAAAERALGSAGILAVLPEEPGVLDPSRRMVAAWVLREAVTNVVRHSGAARCTVELAPRSLRVVDDGCGSSDLVIGNGLRGLRERVAGSGGVLSVSPVSGGGTAVVVTW